MCVCMKRVPLEVEDIQKLPCLLRGKCSKQTNTLVTVFNNFFSSRLEFVVPPSLYLVISFLAKVSLTTVGLSTSFRIFSNTFKGSMRRSLKFFMRQRPCLQTEQTGCSLGV